MLAETVQHIGGRPAENGRSVRPFSSHKLADLHIEFAAGRLMAYRVAWMQSQGQVPNYEASMSKAYGGELNQRLTHMINGFGLSGMLTEGQPYAPLGGRLPRDRSRLVATLDAALEGKVTLRPESSRGL